jgi:uncharacterized repeat protein (TIGR01451 family)
MRSRVFLVVLVSIIAFTLLFSLHSALAAADKQMGRAGALARKEAAHATRVLTTTAAITITKSPPTQTVAQGNAAYFTVTITNSGDVTLTLAVVDPSGDANCLAPPLNPLPAATATSYLCTSSNVTESFTNVITVTGTHVVTPGVEISATASAAASVWVVYPALAVSKSPPSQTVDYGGSAVFTIGLTNSGDIPLALTVVDPTTEACAALAPPSLVAGESVSYACAGAGVSAPFTNVITVTGRYTPTVGSSIVVTDTASAFVQVIPPSLMVSKSPPTQTVPAGGTAVFTIGITNTSLVTLTLTVSDPLADPNCETLAPPALVAGASAVYTCTSSNVSSSFTNIITVTGTHIPPGGEPTVVTATAEAAVIVADPEIIISKLPATQTVPNGGTANFTIFLLNNGNVDLALAVSDPLADENCETLAPAFLAAGASESYNCTRTNVTADFTNIITVTGLYTPTYGDVMTVTDSSSAFVDMVNSSIVITKSPDIQSIPFGGTAAFSITVSNTGEGALTDVSIIDPLAPTCNSQINQLTPGIIFTYMCQSVGITADFTNTITATSRDMFNHLIQDSDTALVDVGPSINVTKTAEPTELSEPGATVQFTVTILNESYEIVSVTALTDNRFGDLLDADNELVSNNTCAAASTIAASATFTCSFYAIFTGQPGVYLSRVTAHVADNEGNQASSAGSVYITILNLPPSMSMTVTAVPNTVIAPGEDVLFTVRINNTSLADPIIINSLVDSVIGNLNGRGTCQTPRTIFLNSFYECVYTTPVTGSSGSSVTHTITASGSDDDDSPVSQSSAVTVNIVAPPLRIVFMPLFFNRYTADEPNNICAEAIPLTTNITYAFLPNDANDWYYFDLTTGGDVSVQLTNFTPLEGQIVVYRGSCGNLEFLANNGNNLETKFVDLSAQPPARYFVWVITAGTFSNTPYNLRVQVP